jgi:hypothetical protein
MKDEKLALFLMLGQTASRSVRSLPGLVPQEALRLSDSIDLAETTPEEVHLAIATSEPYRLFFVFERYLQRFVVATLSNDGKEDWWSKLPPDVQQEVEKLADTEESKSWMSLGSRDKSALMTYPQLLKVIEHRWKDSFEDLLRDRSLIHEARWIGHLRNAVCHMSPIPEEELERIRQVLRDWFRVLPP